MDGIKIAKIVNELDKILLWTRLEKIYQLSKTEIELVFNSKKGKQILYISIAANALRFFLIKNKFSYAKNPPAFCMLLRKHLQGSRLKNIVQLGTDRVVNFTFKTKNEFGTIKEKILVLEMLGRHGNIILLDSENKIIDALRRIPLDMSDKRAIFPKLKYEPILENGKISLFSDSAEKNFSELNINSDEDFIREKLMSIQGLSNKRKDEIIAEIKKGESGIDIIYKIKSFIKNSDGYSSKLEYYYRYEKQETELDKEKNNIIKKLNKENKKILKKLEGYDLLLKKSEEANIYKEKGDLIFANLNNIKKGKKEITLNSFNGDDKIKIDLDLKKSIVQNANDFYKKYHKLKDSVSHINEQKNILKEKIIQIESYITFIKNTENFEDFNNIIFEIYKFKILINYNKKKNKQPQGMNKNRKLREKDFKNLITKNGLKILIGQNNIENDALTFRIADKDDLWFHIKDIPGSHIILRVTGKTPTDDDIMQAAEAAVYYSKARGQKGLPVDFVKVRKIKKIKGSYLGNVSFKENKSIIV